MHVLAPADAAVAGYCIDATEVTNTHYAAFLDADYPIENQSERCAINESYVPHEEWPPPWESDPPDPMPNLPAGPKDHHPVVAVDWCDAAAYCAWAGKRLCGRIGGGMNTLEQDMQEFARSEWFHGCSEGGTVDHPRELHPDYSGTTCNDYVVSYDTWPVGHNQYCATVAGQVFDLVGNVAEWANACGEEDGLGYACRLYGGSVGTTSNACSQPARRRLGLAGRYVGFRCCADAL